MRARDVMTSPVTTLRPEQSVKEAAALLSGRGFTAAPVVDDDGHLIGMVTEADVMRDRILPDARTRIWRDVDTSTPPPRTVLEVMTSPAVAVTPGTDLADIARMMLDDGVRSFPVDDGSRVVGIITRRDLLRTLARDDASILASVRCHLAMYGGADRWAVSVHEGAVTVVDDFDDETDRHVAQVIAEAVPGVTSVEVHSRGQERVR